MFLVFFAIVNQLCHTSALCVLPGLQRESTSIRVYYRLYGNNYLVNTPARQVA